jgi:hypothetical protein
LKPPDPAVWRVTVRETIEARRLHEAYQDGVPWLRWGPYLSERQWGTVREDQSANGDAWGSFSHDQARSRAYRWGEDGLAGISDDGGRLCLALALWNEADPILKERLFGLTNREGNHGEDVKEHYFYLDATPTHSWLRYLYKYPQQAYPYADLVETNARRTRTELEYELLDTGAFDGDRYFDVFVDLAKAAPEELLVEIIAHNRGPDRAPLHVLPTLWFRNTWSGEPGEPGVRPDLATVETPWGAAIRADHPELGRRWLLADGDGAFLFTENETNTQRLYGRPNATPFVKDAFHAYLVDGHADAVNPAPVGTKAAAHRRLVVPPRGSITVRLRLTALDPSDPVTATAWPGGPFGREFGATVARRHREADAFYASITPPGLDPERSLVMRQALAGMIWSKQFYYLDVDRWLDEHGVDPFSPPDRARGVRNTDWVHLLNHDVISMPDTWEYPWYAAWDLAFHALALSMVDPELARQQLDLMIGDLYQHPNGQIPAYEWNFSDVNPPVHAWATLFTYDATRTTGRRPDREFLASAFAKLILNFNWWLNRKDPSGRNVFQGGFLGLDNIGVFDRSSPLPTGGTLEQADGTAWMAFYSLNMLTIALELAEQAPPLGELAARYAEHFLWIAGAMDRIGDHGDELWDEEDGFFYDVLRFPDGHGERLRVRSMVGLMPLCAVAVLPGDLADRYPEAFARVRHFLGRHPELSANIAAPGQPGVLGRRLLAVLDEHKLRRVLARMLDEDEFLSPHGIRSLSRVHLEHPYEFDVGGTAYRVDYEPAESTSGMFGGNSNWRGPVWFPVNVLLIRALLTYYLYYGDALRVECPTGSGRQMTLFEVAREIADRLVSIFLPGPDGGRPVYGATTRFRDDPDWRDLVLFYEYFHGDNGAGLGASHQTGWTGVVARLIQLFAQLDPADLLAAGNRPVVGHYVRDAEEIEEPLLG